MEAKRMKHNMYYGDLTLTLLHSKPLSGVFIGTLKLGYRT